MPAIRSPRAKRAERKKELADLLGGKCRACGYDRCSAALHFHHVHPKEKDFTMGAAFLMISMKLLRQEAMKCVLLCSNCHAEVHAGIRDKRTFLLASIMPVAIVRLGRRPKPWYWAKRDAWYVSLDGHKIKLANGRDGEAPAIWALQDLMSKRSS